MPIHRRRLHRLVLSAAALIGAGLALAAPATAQDDPAAAPDKAATRVILLSRAGEHADGERRRVRILDLNGDASGCDKTEVDDSAAGGGKTKVVVCGDERASAADRAARLERALAGIQQDDSIGAERKAKVTAALREAIDRLHETR